MIFLKYTKDYAVLYLNIKQTLKIIGCKNE